MGFKCGIVGLPNVGKSTLFNALTKSSIAAQNFPFCTIEPNTGIVPVPDSRLDQLADLVKPQRVVQTALEFIDIAGLVAGASKGEGLGNKFLATIREVDAIGHVVRCFDHSDIVHVAGKIDPIEDVQIINTELMLADLSSCENALSKAVKAAKVGDKLAKFAMSVLQKAHDHLEHGKMLRTLLLTTGETLAINHVKFLTIKPTMYIANINEADQENNSYLNQLQSFTKQESALTVPICAVIESELAELSCQDAAELMPDMGIEESGLNRMISSGYTLLNLHTYFTAGQKEVRAWTINLGTTAPQAARKIHTDFAKGFIRAEVISFIDFITYGGEAGAKEAGKWRLEGKDYIVADGDVIHFRFNV